MIHHENNPVLEVSVKFRLKTNNMDVIMNFGLYSICSRAEKNISECKLLCYKFQLQMHQICMLYLFFFSFSFFFFFLFTFAKRKKKTVAIDHICYIY